MGTRPGSKIATHPKTLGKKNSIMFIATMVLGKTYSLNSTDNDETCDYSWLMMLLGNAPLANNL